MCGAGADQLPCRAVVESAFQEHGGVEFEEGSSRRSSYQEEEEYGSEDYDDGEGLGVRA